jgi:pimeloyl-ACP methyl ester carboxylesterase
MGRLAALRDRYRPDKVFHLNHNIGPRAWGQVRTWRFHAMNSLEGSMVTSSDGTSIAFERTGSGPTLILVDPAGGYREVGPMRPLAAQLASHFTVYAYDRRGRGQSTDTPPYSVDREIDDIQALVEAAGGSAFVYGFSSGANLALLAAERGLAIAKVAMLEPPLQVGDEPRSGSDLGAQVAKLVVLGRREEAFERWVRGIGVPAEIIAGMRQDPSWPARTAVAHTLVYDSIIAGTLPAARLSAIATPILVVASDATGGQIETWARTLAEALPNGSLRVMKGMWHGVSPEDLAPVLTEFFIGAETHT